MEKEYKLVIFDFDGVLVHSSPDIVASIQATQKQFNTKVMKAEEIMPYVGWGASYLINNSFPDLCKEKQEEALVWYRNYYATHPVDGSYIFPGIKNMLEYLKSHSVALCILSNKPERLVNIITEKLGVAGYFTLILGPESLKDHMKPDPAGLKMCMEHTGIAPQDTLMVGDTFTDIQAGQRGGVDTCACFYGYGDKQKLTAQSPTHSVSDPNELLTIFCHR